MSARLSRRGATLPLTLIVLSLMGIAVAITYARLSAERRTTGDAQAQLNAFAVAQSGLSRYFSVVTAKPAASPADIVYNDLPGGSATISVRMLRESTTTLLPAVYVVTSKGTNTTAKRYSSAAAPAERSVATYAVWAATPFDLNGAFTSLSGVDQNGAGSGGLSGIDHCTATGGSQPSIPGVAVPTGTYTGSVAPIDGNPDNAPHEMNGTTGPTGTAKDSVQIDWAGIVAGTVLPPDYTAWPASFTNWPVVKISGDFTLPGSGSGILIVTGDLTWNGTPLKTWNGLILVGGNLVSNGQANMYGAMITALNVKLGNTVPQQSVGNGTKTFQYDSCNLARALGHIGYLKRIRNGWNDSWSSY
jgi:type II secretory pathway pseudopilin PulG